MPPPAAAASAAAACDDAAHAPATPRTKKAVLVRTNDDLGTALRRSARLFVHAFSVAYGLRAGLAVFARIIALLRTSPRALASLDNVIGEQHLVMRADSVRQGLFVGGVAAMVELVRFVARCVRARDDAANSAVAGVFAGFALFVLHKSTRRTVALYSFVRMLQCVYRGAKARGVVKPLPHGDAILFAISSAQIMYSFVMRPDALPPSFFRFILSTGPVDATALEAARCVGRRQMVDRDKIEALLRAKMATPVSRARIQQLLQEMNAGARLPCAVMHPQNGGSCAKQFVQTFASTIRKMLPLYSSLTVVPVLLLKLPRVIRSPMHYAIALSTSLMRSLAFIGSFVALYNGAVCALHKIGVHHRVVYFGAALVSSASVLLERKARRAELALYALPRGVHSLMHLLVDRRWLAEMPGADVALFSVALAGIVMFYHHDRPSVPPLVARVLDVIFDEKHAEVSADSASIRRARSFYSQPDDE